MSVGGKKIPPAGGPILEATPQPPSVVANKAPAAAAPAPPARSNPPGDAFEKVPLGSGNIRSDFGDQANTSGIDNMLQLIEQSHQEIVAEHAVWRTRATAIVKTIAQAAFAPDTMRAQREELDDLRLRLHTLRRRLNQLRRRRKSLLLRGHSIDAGQLAAAMLERLQGAEPGVEQSMVALQLLEQAYLQAAGQGDDAPTWRSKSGDAPTGAADHVIELLGGTPGDLTAVGHWLAASKRNVP